jgi:hypothetical protein
MIREDGVMCALRIYVAGSSQEAQLAAHYMRRLQDYTIEVTYNWTEPVIKNTIAGIKDTAMTHEDRVWHASTDLHGVSRADIFWLLAPVTASAGAWVELGAALAHGITCVVSGPWPRCIFANLARYRFTMHEDAFEHLVRGREFVGRVAS